MELQRNDKPETQICSTNENFTKCRNTLDNLKLSDTSNDKTKLPNE